MAREVPRHVAIVMDGNGRWAAAQGWPRSAGHRRGEAVARAVVRAAIERGIRFLTLFAFSTENWDRPQAEISFLFELLTYGVYKHCSELVDEGVEVSFIGDLTALPVRLRKVIETVRARTAGNQRLRLQIALNYSGRWDIVAAVRILARQGANLAELTEEELAGSLATANFPEPDLVIRTSGERRLSNFLLWQSAYSELHFCSAYWPDFDDSCLDRALDDYASRERRYGRIGTADSRIRAAGGGSQ